MALQKHGEPRRNSISFQLLRSRTFRLGIHTTYKMRSLDLIKFQEVYHSILSKLKKLGVDISILPKVSFNQIADGPSVCIENGKYVIKYYEKNGEVNIALETDDFEEAVFFIFKEITHAYSFNYELNNRIAGQDPRIIAFKKHIEILEKLEFHNQHINKLKEKYNKLINQSLF